MLIQQSDLIDRRSHSVSLDFTFAPYHKSTNTSLELDPVRPVCKKLSFEGHHISLVVTPVFHGIFLKEEKKFSIDKKRICQTSSQCRLLFEYDRY